MMLQIATALAVGAYVVLSKEPKRVKTGTWNWTWRTCLMLVHNHQNPFSGNAT